MIDQIQISDLHSKAHWSTMRPDEIWSITCLFAALSPDPVFFPPAMQIDRVLQSSSYPGSSIVVAKRNGGEGEIERGRWRKRENRKKEKKEGHEQRYRRSNKRENWQEGPFSSIRTMRAFLMHWTSMVIFPVISSFSCFNIRLKISQSHGWRCFEHVSLIQFYLKVQQEP